MAIVEASDPFSEEAIAQDSTLYSLGLTPVQPANTSFLGTPGLSGTSTNDNPGSITVGTLNNAGALDNGPINTATPTLNNELNSTSVQQQEMNVLDETPGLFSIKNLLFTASNNILGTNLNTISPSLGTNSTGNPISLSGGNTQNNTSLLSDLFLRSVIIILGFIFVAVGLSMFKNIDIEAAARTVAKNSDPLKGVKKTL